MPPTQPKFSPTSLNQGLKIKAEPQAAPNISDFALVPMQGVVNPLALPAPQLWTDNGFGLFDNDMDTMSPNDYTNIFDDPMSSPKFSLTPENRMSYIDIESDYDDINHLLHTTLPEIALA
jgi:hypothetical protein